MNPSFCPESLAAKISRQFVPLFVGWLFALFALSLVPAKAQTSASQAFNLITGWNAIYLEVAPDDPDPNAVFGGGGIEQVSGYFPRLTSAQFTGSGGSGLDFGKEGWLRWNAGASAAPFNTLGKVLPHRAYLIKAKSDTTLTVNGQVRFHRISWTPDAFNFLGFQVEPGNGPTWRQFFEGSPAHDDLLIYELDLANGNWGRVATASSQIESGKAYWVYCQGGSDHQGPIDLDFPDFGQLSFGKATDVISLDVRNDSLASKIVSVSQNSGLVFDYAVQLLSEGRTNWLDLSSGASIGPLAPNVSSVFRIALDRLASPLNPQGDAIITFQSAGMRLRVPAYAETLVAGTQLNGLWVGNVTIDKVSQISRQGASARGTPTPAGGKFNMRMILHAGSGGVKLLKEVSVMRKKTPEPDGQYRRVLITRDSLLPDYGGIVKRGGKLVGQRISSPFYHFTGTELALSGGGVSLGGDVSGTVVLPANHQTNPFRHQYHPDHITGREIVREFVVRFTGGEGVESTDQPTQGQRLSGNYSETIFGLVHPNKGDIRLEGTIDLQLVSVIDTLNGE